MRNFFLFQNTSIYSLYLALLIVAVFHLGLQKNNKPVLLFGGIAYVLLYLLQSRAAVISCSAGLLMLVHKKYQHQPMGKRLFRIAVLCVSIGLLCYSLAIKQASTQGKWLIWANCVALFTQNWKTGVGAGQFNSSYNHIQAEYFSQQDLLLSKEAMLAADGYFPFNEWLFVAIEFGIGGLVLVLLFTAYVLYCCYTQMNSKWEVALLLAILLNCLFSYALHDLPILLLTALLIGRVIPLRAALILQTEKWYRLLLGAVAGALLFFCVRTFRQERTFIEAQRLAEIGQTNKSVELSNKIASQLVRDAAFNHFYMKLLFDTDRLEALEQWFVQSHVFHCSVQIHRRMAQTFEELGDAAKAEAHYLTGLHIKPSLLQSRVELMEFFSRRNDTAKANYWARQTISFPIKIPSEKANFLKQKAIDLLFPATREN